MGSVCSSSKDLDKEYFGVPLHIIRKRESKLKGDYYPVGASVPFLLQDLALALARSKLSPQPSPHQHIGSGGDDDHHDDDEESRRPQQIQALSFPLDVDRIRTRDMIHQINFITSTTKHVHFSMFAMMFSLDEMDATREELVYLFQHFLQKLPFPVLKPSLLATLLDAIKADSNVQRDWNTVKHHAKGKPRDKDMLDRWNLLTQTQGVRAVGKLELSPELLARIKTTILTEGAIEAPVGEERDDDRVGSFSTFHWVLSTIDSVPGVFFPFEACIAMVEAMSVSAANKEDFALVTVVLLQMFCPQWVALHLRQVSALHVATSPHASSSSSAARSSATQESTSGVQRSISVTSSRGGPSGGGSAGAPGSTALLSPLGGSTATAPPTPHIRSEPTNANVAVSSAAVDGVDKNTNNVSAFTAGRNSLNGSAAMSGAVMGAGGVAQVSAINPSNLSDAHSATTDTHHSAVGGGEGRGSGGVVDELSAPQGPFQNSQNTSAIAKSSVDGGSNTTRSSSATDRTREREHIHHPHPHHRNDQYSPQDSNNNTPSKKVVIRKSSRQYDDDDADIHSGGRDRGRGDNQLSRSGAAGKELKSAMSAFMEGGLGLDDSWVSGGTVSIGRSGEDPGSHRAAGRRNNNNSNRNAAVATPLNERDDVDEGDDEPDQPEWPVRLRETRTMNTEINDKLRDAQRAFMLASDTSSSSANSCEDGGGDKKQQKRHVDAVVVSSSPGSNSVDQQKFQNVVALVELLQRDNQQLRTELGGAMEDISDAFERLHSENVRLKTLVTNVNINKAFKERVQTVLTQMAESNLAVTEDITRTRHELRDLRETVLTNVEDRESVHHEILQAKRETADVHLKWVEVERRVLDASTRVSALEHRVQDTNQRTEEVAAAVGSCVMDHNLLAKRLYSAGAVETAYASNARPTF